MDTRVIPNPIEAPASDWNEGWRYRVAVGAAVLVVILGMAIVWVGVAILERIGGNS